MPLSSFSLSYLLRNQHYCRTVILNLTFGTVVLRELVDVKLNGQTIKDFLNSVPPSNKNKHDLTPGEVFYLETKKLKELDLSKLTRLLLCKMLDGEDYKRTDRLREIRNMLAHATEAVLNSDSLFHESVGIIKELAQSVDNAKGGTPYLASDLSAKIYELEMTELVRIQHIDSIEIKKEYFWTKVIRQRASDTEENLMKMKIRYGLTRYIRQLSACLNIDTFLNDLLKKHVIDDEIQTEIGNTYSFDEQMVILVDYLVRECNDDSVILGAFQCLKESRPNGNILAALVEGSSDDSEKFGSLLQDKIKDILRESLTMRENKSVTTSDVHIYVEKKMKISLDFDIIKDCIRQLFGHNDQHQENDSLSGLSWNVPFEGCYACKSVQHNEAGHNKAPEKKNLALRAFNKPTRDVKYSRCCIDLPEDGNVLEPKHKFVHLSKGRHYTAEFISRECIRFADACINSAQNGTIHFGIMQSKQNEELIEIVGIRKDCICYKNLDLELQSAIDVCFKENANEVKLLVRQVQRIPVDENSQIIEIDIVPFHGYFSNRLVPIHFPPKGIQKKQVKVYNCRHIEDIKNDESQLFEDRKKSVIQERKSLQEQLRNSEVEKLRLQNKLRHLLTNGRRYLTELYSPIIISGNIKGCPNEQAVRENLCIENAFTSCKVVFEFDPSSSVRKSVERENASFKYYTSEALQDESRGNDAFDNNGDKCWIYCNGYENAENLQEKKHMIISDWNKKRKRGVKKALKHVRDKIQKGTCKMIFLVYQRYAEDDRDPMLEMAREPVLDEFPDECIIIAEHESYLTKWKEEFKQFRVNESVFFTGLSLESVLATMQSVFKVNPDVECILPGSKGPVVMTRMEMSEFQDFDIVSGRECILEIENLDEDTLRRKMAETRNDFYRGKDVSWWNFHFGDQIGKRQLLDTVFGNVRHQLENGYESVQLCKIYHQPGAGGTTVGKHIIWLLSQFSCHDSPYRCCILQKNTRNTFQQLKSFRIFKDKTNRRPIILLIDDYEEDKTGEFTNSLRKYVSGIEKFCCIISIHRTQIQEHHPRTNCICLKLEKEERIWFESKGKELERINDIEDINSLIAFNFMKDSFDEDVILCTTRRLIKEIKPIEIKVLKCLALISKYEPTRVTVPIRVFDIFIDEGDNDLWCCKMSESMKLMVKEQNTDVSNGISILCQPLAIAIIKYFEESSEKIEDFVNIILGVLEKLKNTSGLSHNYTVFRHIVSSLFKRSSRQNRTLQEKEGGSFSDLVKTLQIPRPSEGNKAANKRAEIALKDCLDITSDAMVGQQLTRLYIIEFRFKDAIRTIEQSIRFMGRDNSYLLDTFGQIYRTNMINKIQQSSEDEKEIRDIEAADIVAFGFNAIDKFREAQQVALREHPKNKKRNLGCFYNELKTLFALLDAFPKFMASDRSKAECQLFLTSKYDGYHSPYKEIVNICPRTKDLLKGSEFHRKVEQNLQYIESQHQLGYCTEAREMRGRLQEFYDCVGEDISSYPTTLPELQNVFINGQNTMTNEFQIRTTERVESIKRNLEEGTMEEISDRDLLLYIGYFVVMYSANSRMEEYQNILFYSNVVIESQMELTDTIPILETFLYHAVLHWPTQSRASLDSEHFCQPTKYMAYLKHWGDSFQRLHGTQDCGVCVFAVTNGSIGYDIFSVKNIAEGRKWYENPLISEAPFLGKVDRFGEFLSHEVPYSQNRTREFNIEIDRKSSHNLRNKTVTFILGFTWKGPRAFALKVASSAATLERRHPTSAQQSIYSPSSHPGENQPIARHRSLTDKYRNEKAKGDIPKTKTLAEQCPRAENSSTSNLEVQPQASVPLPGQDRSNVPGKHNELNNRQRRLIDQISNDKEFQHMPRADLIQTLLDIERKNSYKATLRVFKEEIQRRLSTR